MKKIYLLTAIAALFFTGCSLDEDLNDSVSIDQSNGLLTAQGTLKYTYNLLEQTGAPWWQFSLSEDTSDEFAKPTRGADWYDGGRWQQLHLHTWTQANQSVFETYNEINKGIAYSTQVLGLPDATEQDKAEATFLQVFFLWQMTDFYGQTILREPNEEASVPSIYWTRSEAIEKEIAMLEAVVEKLPAHSATTAYKASKNAGYALLAKLYLNKAVYRATDADGKPQIVTSSMFQSADMDKVITYIDKAIAGKSFTSISGNTPGQNYFQNFAPDNGEKSTEIIFSKYNAPGNTANVYAFANMTLHYNQNPAGWNGPVTTTDLQNKFLSADPNDPRYSTIIPYLTTNSGLKAGLLIGQQFDKNGVALKTRNGAPLIFTSDFDLGSSTEEKGIRVIKYLPDYANGSSAANDFVLLSYSDCLLMKAEALARKGDLPGAANLVAQLRTARGAASLSGTFTLNTILDERARELYWQGHRRTDQIRFGTFLQPCQGRTAASDRHVMVFPIPLIALAANPKMHQNPGY